jgi:DNA polymerase elongation subunit (family B)
MAYTPKIKRLFFDIETQANLENLGLAPEPKPAVNLKDPEKIAADIAAKKQSLIDMAALDPDYGKVLSIGYATSIDGPITVRMNGEVYFADKYIDLNDPASGVQVEEYTYSEVDLLKDFWNVFTDCRGHCVGYNILGFDLPYLLRRSMALGVKVPFVPSLARYRTEPVTDLMAILYNWGADKYKGLKQVAKLYGIPNNCPDMDGSQVSADISPMLLHAYQKSDVELVIALYQKMNGIYFIH